MEKDSERDSKGERELDTVLPSEVYIEESWGKNGWEKKGMGAEWMDVNELERT